MWSAAQQQDSTSGGVGAEGQCGEDGLSPARAEAQSQRNALEAMSMESSAGWRRPIAGKVWPDEVMIVALNEYYMALPRDTFCGQGQAIDAHDLPWLWKPKDDQISLRLPSSCMLRQKLELPQQCDPAVAANIVLVELHKIGEVVEVDDKLMPASSLPRKQPPVLGKLPFTSKMDHRLYEEWELDSWQADDDIHAHILFVNGDSWGDFAFVSTMPTKFHFRLMLEDLLDLQFFDSKEQAESCGASGPVRRSVRLEAASLFRQEDIDNALFLQVASNFHRLLTGVDSPMYTACIRITGPGACIDLSTMQKALDGNVLPHDTPIWLPDLARRVSGLRMLENHIATYAPVHPAPNPLIMESILHARVGKTKDMLAMIGKGVLREMAALALYVDYPTDNVERQESRLEDLVSDIVCASWMLGGGSRAGEALLKECSAEVNAVVEATTLFHALAGAHFLESGPWAVACLWAWLAGTRELDSALRHTRAPASFCGRTDTYSELHWVKGEQLKEMENFNLHPDYNAASKSKLIKDEEEYLFVVYAGSDHSLYRKGDRCAEELVAGEEWREIVWDPNVGVFCSPTRKRIRQPDADAGGMQLQPLPKKVTACLCGRSLLAQTTLKNKRWSETLRLVRLRETRTYGPEPTLQVVYHDHVQFYYRRDPRGIGIEIGVDSKERQIGYSEAEKTLISPWRRRPLPTLVIDWVCGVQSLVQLARLQGMESTSGPTVASPGLDISANGICRWPAQCPQYSCQLTLVDGRYIFMGREERRLGRPSPVEEPPWEELWYSTQTQGWLLEVSGQTDVHIPKNAVHKVMESIDDSAWVDALRKDLTRSPWLRCPSTLMRQFVSLLPGVGLSEAENKLGHKFSNPSLLVEALTHCSAPPDASPSCERLALVGEETVRAYVSLHSVDHGSIPITASASSGGALSNECLQHSSLAAPRELVSWREALEHPPPCRPAEACPSLEESQRRVLACCNHASYAFSCARLGLPAALRYESPELEVSIQHYVRRSASFVDGQTAPSPPAGAPRLLGDVFLACVGALVLDGQRAKAEELIEAHRKRCLVFEKGLESVVFEPRQLSDTKPSDVFTITSMAVNHSGAAINGVVLAPPPPLPPSSAQEEQENRGLGAKIWSAFGFGRELERLRQKVCRNRDVCVVDAKLGSDGTRTYGGVSPRAAMLLRGRPPEDFGDLGAGDKKSAVDVGADDWPKWCEDCQVDLNSRRQWEDHKIGKKHRKSLGSTKMRRKVDKSREPKGPNKFIFQHQ